MKKLVFLLVLTMPPAFAKAIHAPLPGEVYQAKTIAIVNHTGTQSVTDRAYEELQKWGRFQVVSDATNADILLVVGVQRVSTGASANTYGNSTYVTENHATDITSAFFLHGQQEPFFSESERAAIFRKSATKRCVDDLKKRMEENSSAK